MSELNVLEWLERYDNYMERFSHQLDSQNLTRAVKYMRSLLADRDALVRYVRRIHRDPWDGVNGEEYEALSQELREAIEDVK